MKAVRDKVIVELIRPDTGKIIAKFEGVPMMAKGKVLSVGDGLPQEQNCCKNEDIILFNGYNAQKISEDNDKVILILANADVLAIL